MYFVYNVGNYIVHMSITSPFLGSTNGSYDVRSSVGAPPPDTPTSFHLTSYVPIGSSSGCLMMLANFSVLTLQVSSLVHVLSDNVRKYATRKRKE